ncbi:MAG: hypothetical protein N2Z23_09970 [Pyrinomonadaceae bacterium]|nr:hypothetical protein [Pyrinomonadaceae bacterium]MCX7640750.1 hypothetical protein [Pyrinomonadaceae bacterium]MDW8304645.1 hypothetical protein [Acidobacteriota bacterium]
MKTSIYLETSVIGAYLDNSEPFRRDLTIRWMEHELCEYEAFISPIVRREIEMMPEPYRTGYLKIIEPIRCLDICEEAAILAEAYISRGIFHRKNMIDAFHVALASVNEIDYFVTWSFGRLANVRKQARISVFNLASGFFVPTIVTPEFLVHVN